MREILSIYQEFLVFIFMLGRDTEGYDLYNLSEAISWARHAHQQMFPQSL